MRNRRPNPEEAIALEVMRAQAQAPLARAGLSEAEEAALELRSEGNMWATTREIEYRVEANRETRRRRAQARNLEADVLAKAKEKAAVVDRQAVAQPAPKPKRNRGRPPRKELWLAEVAELYAQDIPLGRALRKAGVTWLGYPERKNIYRLKRFRQLVESYRRKQGER